MDSSAEMVSVPLLDRWCLPYLCSLLAQRREAQNSALKNEENRLKELIDSLLMRCIPIYNLFQVHGD